MSPKIKKGTGYINPKVQDVFNIILVDITTSIFFDVEEQSPHLWRYCL